VLAGPEGHGVIQSLSSWPGEADGWKEKATDRNCGSRPMLSHPSEAENWGLTCVPALETHGEGVGFLRQVVSKPCPERNRLVVAHSVTLRDDNSKTVQKCPLLRRDPAFIQCLIYHNFLARSS
jgi:hypothetical protein